MKILPIALLLLLVTGNALSQQSLEEQISAVNQAQNERKSAERAAAAKAEAEAATRLAAEERRRAEQKAYERKRAERVAALADKEKQRQHELQKALLKEAKTDKIRDQAFEDELRQLEIEERRIALAEKKARAARADDYIDQELRAQAATTDIVQSKADVNRNLSIGTRNLLESEGRSKEKEASRLFR
jgi:hypothetical protein